MNHKYILLFASVFLCLSCKKTQVINKIENVVEQGTYDATSFLNNTIQEKGLLDNYHGFLAKIATGKAGSLQDSTVGKTSQALNAKTLQELITKASGDLSIPGLATEEFKAWILKDTIFLKSVALASTNSHYNARAIPVSINETGGRFRQYNGYLFDKFGQDTYEVTEKAILGLLYQKVFKDWMVADKLTLANIDKALAFYGAPTTFPNGLTMVSNNGTLFTDRFAAQYSARRDNAYGTAKGGYYSIIKTQFITLQKQLRSNAQNYDAIGKSVDSLRVNWEKALMATAIHHLDAATNNLIDASKDSVYAIALHDLSNAASIIRSFKGISAPKIISDAQINDILEQLYSASPSVDYNLVKLSTEASRIQQAILKLKLIYKYSDAQIADYFKKNDIDSRNIGAKW